MAIFNSYVSLPEGNHIDFFALKHMKHQGFSLGSAQLEWHPSAGSYLLHEKKCIVKPPGSIEYVSIADELPSGNFNLLTPKITLIFNGNSSSNPDNWQGRHVNLLEGKPSESPKNLVVSSTLSSTSIIHHWGFSSAERRSFLCISSSSTVSNCRGSLHLTALPDVVGDRQDLWLWENRHRMKNHGGKTQKGLMFGFYHGVFTIKYQGMVDFSNFPKRDKVPRSLSSAEKPSESDKTHGKRWVLCRCWKDDLTSSGSVGNPT